MSVNTYLTTLASEAILDGLEKTNIKASTEALNARLQAHFGSDMAQNFVFGSFSRGTILPRSMDEDSDIDCMVVFSYNDRKPQAYLDRLRTFVASKYARSDVFQSSPTIVLELNHIKFELVPAVRDWTNSLKIPAPASSYQEWIDTDPVEFNNRLVHRNQSHGHLMKPLIRVFKYWNSAAGYVFDSYSLEQFIVNLSYVGVFSALLGESSGNLKDMFFQAVNAIGIDPREAKWKQDKVQQLKNTVAQARQYDRQELHREAEKEIQKILPLY